MPSFIVLALLGSALLILAGLRRRVPAAPDDDWTLAHSALAGSLAFSLRLVLLLACIRSGFEFLAIDEAVRFGLAWGWHASPYFYPNWDGVWLTGPTILWGLLFSLPLPPLPILQLGVLLCQAMTIVAVWVLARGVGGSRRAAALATLIAAAGYPLLWLGNGILAESFLGGVALFAIAATLAFLRASAAGRTARASMLALLAALLAALVTSFHYIGWMAVIAGLALLLPFAFIRRRALGPAALPGSLLIAAASAIFPLAWIYCSWRVFGDPLQFLHNSMDWLTVANDHPPTAAFASGPLVYLRILTPQAALLVPLILLALLRHPARRRLLPLAAYVAALFTLMTLLALRGAANQAPWRSVIVIYLGLVVIAALAADALPPLRRAGRLRLLPIAGILLFLAGWFGMNGLMAHRVEFQLLEVMPHDTIALGHWLRQEARHPQQLIFSPATRIGVHSSDDLGPSWTAWLSYASGTPERIQSIAGKVLTPDALRGFDYLFTYLESPPAGWRTLHAFGRWTISAPPAPAGSLQ